jgi:type I restriction enzyme M protein
VSYHPGESVSFIWSVADLLRGAYKAHDYGKVILPFVVVRRLDQALAPTKEQVLARVELLDEQGIDNRAPVLRKAAGQSFYNVSLLTFERLLDDEGHVADNLRAYLRGFSAGARDIVEKFDFDKQIDKLVDRGLLYRVIARFCDIDLSPGRLSNTDMGYIFEELIRRFAEQSNETAGEHFTPREVVRLMVDLLFLPDGDVLTQAGRIVTMYDAAAGTGGMLSVADEHLRSMNSQARLVPHGQELNDESYAICKADMLIKGQNADNIAFGNSFTEDAFPRSTFDYLIANPPYGVDWSGYAQQIVREHEQKGFDGRFGPGLPSKSDGQLLFVLHKLSKMKPYDSVTGEGGSRMAIVLNGSPLFSGQPGGGESEIRRWMIENDLLEAVIGLPDQLFYNTGIHTYVLVLTNRKPPERAGLVQLIDAREMWVRTRQALGEKRKALSAAHIDEIVRLYGDMAESDTSRLVPNEHFGFRRVVIERPKRARYEGGPVAVERLRDDDRWTPDNVRKADADRADDVIAAVEAAVKDLPEDGVTLTEAANTLKQSSEWKGLLKKAKDAALNAISVDDPLAATLKDPKGRPVADPDLRGQETIPLPDGFDPDDDTVDVLRVGVGEHVAAEVLRHSPEVWVDHSKTKVGYEIPFTRIFYRYTPPRPLEEIDAEIREVEKEILSLLREVSE